MSTSDSLQKKHLERIKVIKNCEPMGKLMKNDKTTDNIM